MFGVGALQLRGGGEGGPPEPSPGPAERVSLLHRDAESPKPELSFEGRTLSGENELVADIRIGDQAVAHQVYGAPQSPPQTPQAPDLLDRLRGLRGSLMNYYSLIDWSCCIPSNFIFAVVIIGGLVAVVLRAQGLLEGTGSNTTDPIGFDPI